MVSLNLLKILDQFNYCQFNEKFYREYFYHVDTGIPQGDSLSPCLWIVYLQCILNDYLEKKSFKWNYHTEYADDVDWIRVHNKKDRIGSDRIG